MRINEAYSKLSGPAPANAAAPVAEVTAKEKAKEASGAAGDAVHVRISARAQELASRGVDADGDRDGGVDEAKVARLREAVQKGTLRVDARAIAAKIVNGE